MAMLLEACLGGSTSAAKLFRNTATHPNQNHPHLLLPLSPSPSFQKYVVRYKKSWNDGGVVRASTTAERFDGSASALLERPWKTTDLRLVLEDGSIWRGKSFGSSGTQVGEVVFNTSLTGYQEILTDPSYAGQFVLMTQPHIGNTGVNFGDEESQQCHLAGLVIRSLSPCVSNWRSQKTLSDYLKERNIMGISDIDTRAITRRLREDGSLIGVLSTDAFKTDEELLHMSRTWHIVGKDLITDVSCTEPYEWKDATSDDWEFSNKVNTSNDTKLHVVAYDFGVKQNILRRLVSYGCKITVVPSKFPASEVLKLNPDGVLFSNGPGDPSAVPYAVDSVRSFLGKLPVFGICMGHQLLGQALGGKTFKMKFGHHGGNHPVRHLPTGRIEISAQNHNYAVDIASLPEGVEVTHINLNDGTCAGLTIPAMKVMSIQYHPEASPGPHDADPAFYDFVQMMSQNQA
ncbi:hypothetical protein O6H91_06G090500 [Diphasiastrum complanatum]|uniref:Uncharacterized protein n=1 Tax=Diphasiastrum complanatum TaxID=34168 RepID=A0ACC2DG70_DIPCM|nr:hypothetical protein O6H91_06G090500 [Diphasiastrum complanatum]